MREIKFRFWNKQRNRWTLENNFVFLDYPEKYIPLQYTGLKDKNGKKIYEGDIVKYKEDDVHIGYQLNSIGFRIITIVGFIAGHFIIFKGNKIEDRKTAGHYDLWKVKNSCEVIGNIYENPELLKQK